MVRRLVLAGAGPHGSSRSPWSQLSASGRDRVVRGVGRATAGPAHAAQLLTDIARTTTTALSGKVTETANLGLPTCPAPPDAASLSWQTFLTGSHSVRVWVDGADKQRLALIGELSEADVVHNGRDLWTYTSDTNTVEPHACCPPHAAHATTSPDPDPRRADPGRGDRAGAEGGLADHVGDGRPDADGRRTAGLHAGHRPARRPLDGAQGHDRDRRDDFRPAAGAGVRRVSTPRVQVGFTEISFATPGGLDVRLPDPGRRHRDDEPVHRRTVRAAGDARGTGPDATTGDAALRPRVIGSGWTSVVEVRSADQLRGAAGLIAQLTTPVGTSGMRLLHTALVNAVSCPTAGRSSARSARRSRAHRRHHRTLTPVTSAAARPGPRADARPRPQPCARRPDPAFGEQVAVDGVDLPSRAARCTASSGPNGSGKTTTIRMLLGLIAADAGEIEVLGPADAARQPRACCRGSAR